MSRLAVSIRLTRLARLAAVASLAAIFATAPLAAQSPDTTGALPFRRGQWGMDFGISGLNTHRIGAVRFTSPTRAWILDGRIAGEIARQELLLAPGDTVPSGYPTDEIRQGGSASLLVGRRAYRPLGARAMRTISLSVGGGIDYGESLAEGRRTGNRVNSNATAQFALGGHYRVTPSLALGASFGLGASYVWGERDALFGRQRTQYVTAGLGTSELVLSLFF